LEHQVQGHVAKCTAATAKLASDAFGLSMLAWTQGPLNAVLSWCLALLQGFNTSQARAAERRALLHHRHDPFFVPCVLHE